MSFRDIFIVFPRPVRLGFDVEFGSGYIMDIVSYYVRFEMTDLEKALVRERGKLSRQEESVRATKALIELLEQQVKNESVAKGR